MPSNNSLVKFKYCTFEDYSNLSSKDTNSVYFAYDTRQIFVGDNEYTRPIIVNNNTDPSVACVPNSFCINSFTDSSGSKN